MAQTFLCSQILLILQSTKGITVDGNIYQCPTDWTVEQAEGSIRHRYGLQGGEIEHDNLAVLGTTLISTFTGNLVFVGGHSSIQPPGK